MDWKHIRLIKHILWVSFSEFICFLYWLYLEECMYSGKNLYGITLKFSSISNFSNISVFQVGLNWTEVLLFVMTSVLFFIF